MEAASLALAAASLSLCSTACDWLTDSLVNASLTLAAALVKVDSSEATDSLALLISVARLVDASAEAFAEAVEVDVAALNEASLASCKLVDASLACDWATDRLWLASDHCDCKDCSLTDCSLRLLKEFEILWSSLEALARLANDLLISADWLASEADKLLTLNWETEASDMDATEA